MKVEFTHGINVIVTREPGDKKFRTESAFWHALKKHLNAQGHDLIKKVMSKDGHMYGSDTYPYYLRDRKKTWCIYDDAYAVRHLHETWNDPEGGRVVLVKYDLKD